jgi:CRISPR-associated protein Csx3
MTRNDSTNELLSTINVLPAILIGGPPRAGKSVLTYNLTRELRRRNIPHYVFRASADIEGDWYLQGDMETVDQIVQKVKEYRHWTDIFRAFVCRDLKHRHLPLIVDLGGLPKDADTCIFQVCTHSVLLLKDEDEEATRTWHRFTAASGMTPLAELRSQLEGISVLTEQDPVIKGTITGLQPHTHIHNEVFEVLLERIEQLFSSFDLKELEKIHLTNAGIEDIVHLPHLLASIAPDTIDAATGEWAADMLPQLLTRVPVQQDCAVYGRAPNWVYGALALHTGKRLFRQFDARLGWVTLPVLGNSSSNQALRSLVSIEEECRDDAYKILIHPVYNYLDYREADQLVFPEPPLDLGVIIDGKLPFWLFTALARFYAQRNVPWIAFNDAHDNRPVVIASTMPSHPVGKILPRLA